MAKMSKGSGGSNYPCSPAEIDAANSRAHVPHGPNIPPQTEDGAKALVSSHRQVMDRGPLVRTQPHPTEQSSPLKGSVDLPYSVPKKAQQGY